jgi:hypothetical protein
VIFRLPDRELGLSIRTDDHAAWVDGARAALGR